MLSFLTLVFLPVFFPPLLLSLFSTFSSFCLPDLKDFQNNKHRYLLASENQRPGNFSTASMGSLTSSPSSCSLNSQVGLTSVTSIQERIMSTPGGEEAIERLKVSLKIECRAFCVILEGRTRTEWASQKFWLSTLSGILFTITQGPPLPTVPICRQLRAVLL